MLNSHLEKLEDGDQLSCLERLRVPLGRNMDNVMTLMGNLAMGEASFGFSNPGGSRNLSVAVSGFSMEQFNQLRSVCNSLKVEVKGLQATGDDSCIELGDNTFLNVGEFIAYYSTTSLSSSVQPTERNLLQNFKFVSLTRQACCC